MKVPRKKRPGRVLAFVEKSTEREMYKTTEESVEESELAVDSGEMGGTYEEKDDSRQPYQWLHGGVQRMHFSFLCGLQIIYFDRPFDG